MWVFADIIVGKKSWPKAQLWREAAEIEPQKSESEPRLECVWKSKESELKV